MAGDKQRKKVCAYCGADNWTTSDHIPPAACFPSPRPSTLITVPCCEKCNHGFSNDDEEFVAFLSLRVGSRVPVTQKLHETNIRRVKKNRRLFREIVDRTTRAPVNEGETTVGRVPTFHWHGSKHDQMIRRIIQGLYFHIMEVPLPPNAPIHGTWSKPFVEPESIELWRTSPGENIGDDGQFRYRYLYDPENPTISFWMLTFYDHHFAVGRTGIWDDESPEKIIE